MDTIPCPFEKTAAYLREDHPMNDTSVEKRNDELSYEIARRITKTWRSLFGGKDDAS